MTLGHCQLCHSRANSVFDAHASPPLTTVPESQAALELRRRRVAVLDRVDRAPFIRRHRSGRRPRWSWRRRLARWKLRRRGRGQAQPRAQRCGLDRSGAFPLGARLGRRVLRRSIHRHRDRLSGLIKPARPPGPKSPMLIHGKCHCGNIRFALTWDPDPSEIPARACTCSFCVKHGGCGPRTPPVSSKWRSRTRRSFPRTPSGPELPSSMSASGAASYRWSRSLIEERLYAVVSVNAFEGVDPSLLGRASASFDGEGTDTRLERRKRNWIAKVTWSRR